MRSRFFRKNQGIITVFVVLIMVPVVVITGLMVDIARAKLFAAQVAMSSDFYGEAILSEYDNVLKELYGLFSVTQNDKGKDAIKTYASYMGYSFDPAKGDSGLTGSMFYNSADFDFSYEVIELSRLSNENVLLTQVADYMEFRVIPQVMDEAGKFDGGIFKMLDEFGQMESNNEAVSAANKLCDETDKLTKAIKNFYEALEKVRKYEAYLKVLEGKVEDYKKKEAEICNSGEYSDYVYYLLNEDYIKSLIEQSKNPPAEDDDEGDEEDNEEKERENALVEKYKDYDPGAYSASIADEMNKKSEAANEWESDPADFYTIDSLVCDLGDKATEVEDLLVKVQIRLAELRQKLANGCTDAVKEGIEHDIKELEDLAAFQGEFQRIYDNELRENEGKNEANQEEMENALGVLDDINGELTRGDRDPGDDADINNTKVTFEWIAAKSSDIDSNGLYDYLIELFTGPASKEKSEAEKKQDEALDKQKEAVDELNEQEEKEEQELSEKIRSIPDDVKSELKMTVSNGDSSSFVDFFKNGFSFKALEKSAARLFDKFLLTEYDFGMFSSRVSGKEKGEGSGEVEDYSLSKVKMSPKVNYLYGAEIEYLFGGNQKSEKNLASARNMICGVRMTMNFISTYTVKEVNDAINAISDAAYNAAMASGAFTFGAGTALAPLVKVAVSLALRSGIAAIETVKDWEHLKNREDVVLLKQEINDLWCIADIKSLLGAEYKGGDGGGVSSNNGIKLSYEDYLHVLLFLCISPGDLTSRTSDLITLNVNQSQNSGKTLSAPLKFKMTETATAVKTTCKAKLDMVVVPQHFMDMFLGGDETQKMIEKLDDDYVYYTMIRGY